MKNWLFATFALGLSLLTVSYPPFAKADAWDKKTELTFSAPVELPGIVLAPGTYVFKLLDSPSSRDIVQVFSKDGSKLYATILAIPDYRPTPASKTIVRFDERPTGTPEAIKEWFYPGDEYGQEFVYPRNRAIQLAKVNNQSVAAMPNETARNITKPAKTATEPAVVALKSAPVVAVNPQGAEVEIAKAATPKPVPPQNTNTVAANTKTAAELPKTSSNLPLIFLIGLISLGLSLSLRSFSRRIG
jgi:hypothetical protein